MIRKVIERIAIGADGWVPPLNLGRHDELEMRADTSGRLTGVYVTRVVLDEQMAVSGSDVRVRRSRRR